ncbi:hypothetical protein N431DRAFT_342646, partial [Stipitochalara longipes BDJ]
KFEPKWPDEPNEDGVYLPDDLDSRTPHPSTTPKSLWDVISSTYCPRRIPDNACATFKLFPKLPFELRRIIWRLSLPGQRVVELLYDDTTGQCKSPCPVPTALHINSESRGVALESYELAFGTAKAVAVVYFDFGVDALYVGLGNFSPSQTDPSRRLFRDLQRKDLERLEHLITDDDMSHFYESESVSTKSPTGLKNHTMTSLKSLTLIMSEDNFELVIHETENNPGEFHPWFINKEGKLVPWSLLKIWDFLSSLYMERMVHEESINLPILRAVSRERLKRDSRWAERIEFLDRTVLNGDGCLYIKDGIIDKLSEMENNEPDKYYQVGAQIGQSLGFAGSSLDPIHVYTCQNTCSCAIGHKKKHHIPEFFPDVSNVDIRAILAQVNGAESA